MQMFNEYNDVVKINDLIKMLGIGRNTAYKLVKTNAIPSIRIGRKHYITKQQVIAFLDSNSVNG